MADENLSDILEVSKSASRETIRSAFKRLSAEPEQVQRLEEIRKKRLVDLKAQCERDRGPDCSNPQTLRNQELQHFPRPLYPRIG